MSSTTRLLILGAVRIFQPVHGYDLRRELMSWRADQWAKVSFGSIYFSLQKMARDGLLAELETDRAGRRPERTRYRLTEGGEAEFQHLLREYWWERKPITDPFMVGLSFVSALPRSEVVSALRHRATAARAAAERAAHDERARSEAEADTGTLSPAHIATELFRLRAAHHRAEAEWAEGLIARIESGEVPFPEQPSDSWG